MEDMNRIILLNSHIERPRKALLAVPQDTGHHGAKKATNGNSEKEIPVDAALIDGNLNLVLLLVCTTCRLKQGTHNLEELAGVPFRTLVTCRVKMSYDLP